SSSAGGAGSPAVPGPGPAVVPAVASVAGSAPASPRGSGAGCAGPLCAARSSLSSTSHGGALVASPGSALGAPESCAAGGLLCGGLLCGGGAAATGEFCGSQDVPPEAGAGLPWAGAPEVGRVGGGGVPSETTRSTRTCSPRVSARARCTCSECPPLLNAEARPPVENPSCSVLASRATTWACWEISAHVVRFTVVSVSSTSGQRRRT